PPNAEVAAAAATEASDPAAPDLDLATDLGTRCDRDRHRVPLERGDGELAAQGQRRKRRLQPNDQVVPLSLERLLRGDGQNYVQISGRASPGPRVALARKAQARTGLDPRRDADLELALTACAPLPPALATR